MDAAHALLSAANFLTLADCVQVVVAQVCDAMTPVRARMHRRNEVPAPQNPLFNDSDRSTPPFAQEDAVPWLRLALDDTLGVFDSTLKLHAIGELLSLVGAPGAAMALPVLGVLRAGVARCSAAELLQLRLFGLTVTAGEPEAAPWAVDAVPPLQSPRSPARRPVTFINLRDAPVDVIWIGFDGAERRYARAVDNVESRVRRARARCLRVVCHARARAAATALCIARGSSRIVAHMHLCVRVALSAAD
jgi:hypothetical protein